MSDITVADLAKDVGISLDRLLKQLGEAGVQKTSEDEMISEDEKKSLLTFLRKSHGSKATDGDKPKKITLKRKTTTVLTQSSNSSKSPARGAKPARGVNVEVRKKRTYVKRDVAVNADETLNADAEAAKKALADQAAQQEVAAKGNEARKDAQSKLLDAAKQKKEKAAQKIRDEEAAKKAEEDRVAQEKTDAEAKQNKAKVKVEAEKKKDAPVAPPADKPTRKGKKKEAGSRDRKELHVSADKRGKRKATRNKRGARQPVVQVDQQHGFQKPVDAVVYDVEVPESISIPDLAAQMSIKGTEVIKELMKMGMMVTINQIIDQDTAALVVEELGHKFVFKKTEDVEEEIISQIEEEEEEVGEKSPRPPVVTIMGHVDHGKTSLLDYIRESKVADGEAGGITQHIGAYHVETKEGVITFLDTPGHAAFSAMRARGAKATDIVIIVVAADDGVMPQTKEAIQHSKASGVPIIIAINKMDKPDAQADRVMQELVAEEVVPEDWGGDTMFMKVSAKTGEGIDELLEAITLQAEVLELQAVVDGKARGVVVEASLEKGRGTVATILVQSGTLKQGDSIAAGAQSGRVRALFDENGKKIKSAGPSIPVQVLGLSATPSAGDEMRAVANEKLARELAESRKEKMRDSLIAEQKAAKLDQMFSRMAEGEVNYVNLVVKADVQGSLEALKESLGSISVDNVRVRLVGTGVGGINDSDATLALTTGAAIIGFNVRAEPTARQIIEKNDIDLRYYSIIYEVIDDIKKAVSGLLSPEIKEEIVGLAEVRDVFRSSKLGAIAGCMVIEGSVKRNNPIRVLRDNVVIYEGELESLRRHKDDVAEVKSGTECGIGVKNYNDVKEGDQIEVFERTEVARTVE